ncbi:MAG: 30S ribosomal protein S9 [Nanoarchaeota archaeon]|nr:30S ribosomal protein S9 [Nanoarchaeota archaeon]
MENKIVTSGKRKTAIAKAMIKEGNGKVTINKKNYQNLQLFDKLEIEEPLRIYERVIGKRNFDASIIVRGGGEKSQVEASRLALSKALVKFANSEELTKSLLDYDRNLLVADVRRKEAYKPGDSRARSKRQSSKR